MKPLLQSHAIDKRVDVVSVGDDSKLWAFLKALNPSKPGDHSKHGVWGRYPLVALDPGETTGIAIWDPSSKVTLLAQLNTKEIGKGYDAIFSIINYLSLDTPALLHVRYEDYRVYGHMTEQHSFSHLHTARVIGAIEVACHLARVPSSCALAVHAKSFWTDDKLKLCNVYNSGLKHARDAQRHLYRYMGEALYGPK